MNSNSELESFALLVQKMRAKQKDYYKSVRHQNYSRMNYLLQECKELEKEVDQQLVSILSGPQSKITF